MSVLLFLSRGFFASQNCRRELYQALRLDKPLVVVYEADPNKGGASLNALKKECGVHCEHRSSRLSKADESARKSSLMLGELENVPERVFSEERSIIQWVRVRDFQLVALRLIAAGALVVQLSPLVLSLQTVPFHPRDRADLPIEASRFTERHVHQLQHCGRGALSAWRRSRTEPGTPSISPALCLHLQLVALN